MQTIRKTLGVAVTVLMMLVLQGCDANAEYGRFGPNRGSIAPSAPRPIPTGENYVVTARPVTSGALRITSVPTGIDCLNNDNTQGDRCVETYPLNSTVRLTAEAQSGHTFVRWEGVPCDNIATELCTITGLSAPVTVRAVSNPVAPPPSNRITWTGAVSNVWSIPANWDLDRVPALADEVFIGSLGGPNILASATAVEVDRIVLNGTLFVSAGVTLRVTKDLNGTGSLRVLSDGSAAGRLEFGASSSLRQVSSSGLLSALGGGLGTFDDKPTFRVEQAAFSTAAGAQPPSMLNLQLEATQAVTIDGHLGSASGSTLRVLNGAELTWTGPLLGGVTMGSGGQFIGGCRLQNLGTVNVGVGWGVNCRLENDGVISLGGSATFTARGVNRGTIRSLGLLGSPAMLTFSGGSGAAPHWEFEPTSIMTEGIQRITIGAGSIVQGRVTARSLVLAVSRHRVHTAEITIDSLTVTADTVDLRFTGTFALTQLTLSGGLKVPDGSTVRATRSTLTLGGGLLGGVLESQDVGFFSTVTLAGRLAVTGTATATQATVVGRGGTLELRGGTLDMNPGSSNTIDIRPERPGVGTDLRVINDGLIRKRGGGAARIEACFQGGGSVVNDAGAQAVTIVNLTC